jgi:hypothetical protein
MALQYFLYVIVDQLRFGTPHRPVIDNHSNAIDIFVVSNYFKHVLDYVIAISTSLMR